MAQSRCSYGSTGFEIKELNVNVPGQGPSMNRFMAIQCSQCGLVYSTHEGMYLGRALVEIAKKLGVDLG